MYCKSIGCANTTEHSNHPDFCIDCSPIPLNGDRRKNHTTAYAVAMANQETQQTSSGGDNDYWLIPVPHPKRLEPYVAEAEDIIEALEMNFQEGEAFKAIIRKCKLRMGDGKPGDTELRNAEKVAHFGQRMVAMETHQLTPPHELH